MRERRLRVFYGVIDNCNCYFVPFWCLNDGRAVSKTSSKYGIIHDLMSRRKTGPQNFVHTSTTCYTHTYASASTHTRTHETFSSEDQRNSSKNVSKFTKNQNQLIAQYVIFVVRSATCFGHIYWTSSGSDMQRCFNLRLILCGYNCCCVLFIHSVFCLTTGPKPPLKRFLHIVRSRASSFK